MMESSTLLTALAYSGGKQSKCLMAMILNKHYVIDGPFIVLNADPGMENSESRKHVEEMQKRCEVAGIPFLSAKRFLYQEIIQLKEDVKWGRKSRFDMPPFWTKNRETGKKGRLKQACTTAYKIQPMDRLMRRWMEENLGISRASKRLGQKIVRKLIGFSADELIRIKETTTGAKYTYFDYPLIEKHMGEKEIIKYYIENKEKIPPRSVCNACFANDIATFKEMFENRKSDWEQAVLIDEAIRDLRMIGVRDECFVSSTLIALKELAEIGFILPVKIKEEADQKCHSGHCFV